jgi:hypothetical protein
LHSGCREGSCHVGDTWYLMDVVAQKLLRNLYSLVVRMH